MKEEGYYTVSGDLSRAPISDYLMHGYYSRWDFHEALYRLSRRWRGRVGKCVDRRHDFLLLRFYDTPGGMPDEEWLPAYLLDPAPAPPAPPPPDPDEEELSSVFGFD